MERTKLPISIKRLGGANGKLFAEITAGVDVGVTKFALNSAKSPLLPPRTL